MAKKVVTDRGVCIRVACVAFRISESCYRYERKLDAENNEVATWLIRLTNSHRNWGFGLCYLYLRNVKGFKWNHKRVYRIYKEMGLNLRIKPRKRSGLVDLNKLTPIDKCHGAGLKRCRVVHGGGRRLSTNDRRGGQLGAHRRFHFTQPLLMAAS